MLFSYLSKQPQEDMVNDGVVGVYVGTQKYAKESQAGSRYADQLSGYFTRRSGFHPRFFA